MNVPPKFPSQPPQQPPQTTSMFASQPFPSQFPPASNPFVQQPFAPSKINERSNVKPFSYCTSRHIIEFLQYATTQSSKSVSGINPNHWRNLCLSFSSRISLNNNNHHQQQLNNFPINSANHVQIQQILFFNTHVFEQNLVKISFKHYFFSFLFLAFSLQWTSHQCYLSLWYNTKKKRLRTNSIHAHSETAFFFFWWWFNSLITNQTSTRLLRFIYSYPTSLYELFFFLW